MNQAPAALPWRFRFPQVLPVQLPPPPPWSAKPIPDHGVVRATETVVPGGPYNTKQPRKRLRTAFDVYVFRHMFVSPSQRGCITGECTPEDNVENNKMFDEREKRKRSELTGKRDPGSTCTTSCGFFHQQVTGAISVDAALSNVDNMMLVAEFHNTAVPGESPESLARRVELRKEFSEAAAKQRNLIRDAAQRERGRVQNDEHQYSVYYDSTEKKSAALAHYAQWDTPVEKRTWTGTGATTLAHFERDYRDGYSEWDQGQRDHFWGGTCTPDVLVSMLWLPFADVIDVR